MDSTSYHGSFGPVLNRPKCKWLRWPVMLCFSIPATCIWADHVHVPTRAMCSIDLKIQLTTRAVDLMRARLMSVWDRPDTSLGLILWIRLLIMVVLDLYSIGPKAHSFVRPPCYASMQATCIWSDRVQVPTVAISKLLL